MKTYNNDYPVAMPRLPLWTALAATLVLGSPAAAVADIVSDCNEVTETTIQAGGGSPGIYYALVHLAIYDAVEAIDHKYLPYAIRPSSPTDGASQEAAAIAAAFTVLGELYPDQAAALDQAYPAALAEVADGNAKDLGVAVGKEVALALLKSRENDGRYESGSYTFEYGPGIYQSTPPFFSDPILPAQGKVQPFAIPDKMHLFRASGPPDLTSAQYTQEFREVKRLGGADSMARTPEQTEIARFYWESPVTFWTHNYRAYVQGKELSTSDAARLWAMLSTSFADASIACWDSKYHFNAWRPVTAIQNADSDGNPGTGADPNWLPLGPTPPHPEYPSAHACITSAMNEALAVYTGTYDIPMQLTSAIPGSTTHHFANLQEQIDELVNARVWAGFHFRGANVAGAELGRTVGLYISRHFFQPVPSPQ